MWKPLIIAVLGIALIPDLVFARGTREENGPDIYEGQAPADNLADVKVIQNAQATFKGDNDIRADLINSMKQQASALAVGEPGNWQAYLQAPIQSSAAKDIQITTPEGVDGVLQSWGLPQQVRDFLANIKYAESVDYQTFRFVMQLGRSTIDEFVASGRNYNGKVQLSFIKVNASANAKTQYVVTRRCRKVALFFRKCNRVHTARGFTTGELEVMQNAMLNHAYVRLSNEANSLAVYLQSVPLDFFE